jgi:hypothetical protein
MHTVNAELVESLQHFITIWGLIGKPFPQIDATDRPGLAISWREHAYGFVAYEGDKPVSTATAIINGTVQRLWGSSGASCLAKSLRGDRHPTDRAACHRTRIPHISASWIPPDCEIHGMHSGVLTATSGKRWRTASRRASSCCVSSHCSW